jgi:FtsH-binding integral membrane protein
MRTSTLDLPPAVATRRRAIVVAAALDIGSILVFVLVGRRSHSEGGSFLSETAKVAASFLIALAVSWLIVRAWRAPRSARTGAVVWFVTVAGGMALRPVFGRDVPATFVIVTAIFLGLFLMGWRAVARRLSQRRA